jgi:hypothetical protein
MLLVSFIIRKTPDDGQRNCPKHVDFPSKKFEKLMHLVSFIIRKTPDDGQRNCPKHVDFPSKKFENQCI